MNTCRAILVMLLVLLMPVQGVAAVLLGGCLMGGDMAGSSAAMADVPPCHSMTDEQPSAPEQGTDQSYCAHCSACQHVPSLFFVGNLVAGNHPVAGEPADSLSPFRLGDMMFSLLRPPRA